MTRPGDGDIREQAFDARVDHLAEYVSNARYRNGRTVAPELTDALCQKIARWLLVSDAHRLFAPQPSVDGATVDEAAVMLAALHQADSVLSYIIHRGEIRNLSEGTQEQVRETFDAVAKITRRRA